jgi:hypothetical protein
MSLSASRAIADGATFSDRVARNQKVFLGLCVCALLLNYLDRASVSIAASEIKADLSLSATSPSLSGSESTGLRPAAE